MLDVSSKSQKTFFRRDPLSSIVYAISVYLLSQLSAGIILAFYPALRSWTEEQSMEWLNNEIAAQFVYILLAEVFSIWLIFWLLKRAKKLKSQIGLVKPVIKDVGRALLGYGVYFLSYIAVITIAGSLTTVIDLEQPQQIGFSRSSNQLELLMTFASLVILPPLAEEIMFRGFLFSSFRAKYRFRYSLIFTSILFGLVHLQFGSGAPLLWVAAIDTFILSAALCYLREKTGSLWPAIFLHAIKNGVAFVVLMSQGKL